MSVVYLVNQYSTEAELTEEWRGGNGTPSA